MSILFWIILSTAIISFISFVGLLVLVFKEKLLNKILLGLVALSAGALIGGAFLHLIPESLELAKQFNIFIYLLIGFILFFLIEKILYWRHCHKIKCPVHTFAYMNLIGDFAHNLIDGLIIAASFIVSIPLGIATSIAVALHEIPQELGDFGVLIYGGFNKFKAITLNFIVALTAIIGGIAGYYLARLTEQVTIFLLPFAAGGFIYIAASDLIPEIRKQKEKGKSILTFLIFLLGIAIMFGVRLI